MAFSSSIRFRNSCRFLEAKSVPIPEPVSLQSSVSVAVWVTAVVLLVVADTRRRTAVQTPLDSLHAIMYRFLAPVLSAQLMSVTG
ncbi:hypothetical protein GWK47_040070 [Chionoecetes opilio]|uniref:Uncharacterized protein n=1 Tax=Chionoecetes opilio TaxID=41210 RepID=A0A8J4YB00_CHIOP|nr:hypothetical protein GWK47_040070 [Chionoecetes opilio]